MAVMELKTKKKTRGEEFVEELQNGIFKKNNRPNHGSDFADGLEGLYYYYFDKYISSCNCFLMDKRIKRGEYRE